MAEQAKAEVTLGSLLPEPQQVIRENGDSVVELRQNGRLVGEINFTLIVGNVVEQLFGVRVNRPQLKVVE